MMSAARSVPMSSMRLLRVSAIEMLERVGGGLVVELSDDGSGFARREVADDLGELGGMQPR